MKFKLSNHALVKMERRGIPREMLERILDNPQQVRTLCGHFFRLLVANGTTIGFSQAIKLPRKSPRHHLAS